MKVILATFLCALCVAIGVDESFNDLAQVSAEAGCNGCGGCCSCGCHCPCDCDDDHQEPSCYTTEECPEPSVCLEAQSLYEMWKRHDVDAIVFGNQSGCLDPCELYQMYQACCFGCDARITVEELMEMFDYDESCCLSYREFFLLVEYVRANVNPNFLGSLS